MVDFAREQITSNEVFSKKKAVQWFKNHYPKINSHTIGIHVEVMSINSPRRVNFPYIKAGSGHDLFFREGKDKYRLWDASSDPAPQYKDDFINEVHIDIDDVDIDASIDENVAIPEILGAAFAYEQHLRDYLANNLTVLEPGLKLYEEEGITGIEFPVGGRRIDILALDKSNDFVVIELKVSRGYDRVVGQLLRYMTWIEEHLAAGKKTRGIIIANDISDDLRMATRRISGVSLFEYEINFKLKAII